MTLVARDVSLSIRGKILLEGVDFTARPGHVSAIVGPNGSGKTTLMRVIVGEESARGLICLNGHRINRAASQRLATIRGVLPQSNRIAFPFRVSEVISIGQHAGPFADDPGLPERALQAVGLGGFGQRYYQELSGGEQQRVQLARVLSQVWQPVLDDDPCWLFLDEPVASLDIAHQLGIMQIARDYADRGGGVVAIMHDLNLTSMFADAVTIMKAGRVLAAGLPVDVLTDDILSDAYGCAIRTCTPPSPHKPYILPHSASAH